VDRLLRLGVPADQREPIAGDLEEEFADLVERRGRVYADVAIWAAAARVAWRFRVHRAVQGRPLPPIADEVRRGAFWDSMRQDVRFGLRMLRRQPAFTAVALLALALGIGANTTIFSVVDAVLWRALPYPGAAEIVSIAEARPRENIVNGSVAPADFFDWRRESRSFAAMAAYMETALNLIAPGEPERLNGLAVSPGFLAALGMSPSDGRDLRPEEEIQGRHRVVLLTDALWRRRFGADPTIVGRTLTLDGNPYDVVGILPARFWWPTRPDLLVPLAISDRDRTLRGAHFLGVIARLAPGVSGAQARVEMAGIGERLSAAFPADNATHTNSVLPLRDVLVGDIRTTLLVLLGAVALVLLIACANVAALLLARASSRQRELAIRMTLGGARRRLVRQMLTESLVLSALGGGAGILLAAGSIGMWRQVLPSQFAALPGIDTLGLDGRVLAAALLVSLGTGVVFGVAPAFVASDHRAGRVLNDATRGSIGGVRGRRLRSMLIVAELALSLVLLVGAGLLIASFWKIVDVSPGFQPARVTTTRVSLPGAVYDDHAKAVAFYQAVLERLHAAPGIDRAAVTSAPPFSGLNNRLDLIIENRTIESPFPIRAHPRLVSAGYFQTMGIPLVRGRTFDDQDRPGAPLVAILNQSAVRRFWPDRDPLGERISLGRPGRWMAIVGVVGDVTHDGLDVGAEPEVYLPLPQEFSSLGSGFARGLTVVVRAAGDAAVAPLLRSAVSDVDDRQPVAAIRQMDELIAQSVAPRRLNLLLLSAFAGVAVVLTAAGLYGVMSYLVAQRTREIGLRMALGATPASMLGLVLRQAGAMTAAGIVVGLLGALLLARSLASLLFGVNPTDLAVYVAVSALLAVVASVAIAIPCARAARVDPIIALRDS
jgi:putative ABC transport system permease protein